MAKASPIKTSFNAGQWSGLMGGQILLEKYGDSCSVLENLIPLKQGPVVRRGGTRFIKEVKTSSKDTVLIPFQFNVEQAYMIEMGDSYFRFYKDNGAIVESSQNITGITQANPAVVTVTGHGYSNGDEVYIDAVVGMTEVNGKYFRVANVTANTFEIQDIDLNDIDSTAYSAYTSGGTASRVYEVSSPYSDTDLLDSDKIANYQFAQSADVLYLVHPDYAPRSLSRSGDTSWNVQEMNFVDGPYFPENTTDTTLTLSGTTGSVTVTASAVTGINDGSGFLNTDVGRLIRWKDDANEWTWLKITAVGGTTSVTADILGQDASATTATKSWRLGLYSETTGYPSAITFFQNRVVLCGSASRPDRYDLTASGGYSDAEFTFSPSDPDGTVTDDAGINGTLQSGQVNAIQWADTDDRGLVIGTRSREWIVRPSTTNEVLTPSNAKADPFSSIGSSAVRPVRAENGTIFVQRSRRKVLDVIYSFERDQLKPRDLTITSDDITISGVCEMSFQQEPLNVVWMRLTNGKLVGLTYYPDENVYAFHPHIIGGTDSKVVSISTIPSASADRDELWMIVERTINGVTRKYVEYMTRYYESDIGISNAFHVDSGLSYSGAATGTVSGLDHIEGETVNVLVDGKTHPQLTVSNGAIELLNNVTASTIQVGLPNTWCLVTQRIEAGAKDGTAQGKTKRITRFVVRLLETLGLHYGESKTSFDEYDFNLNKEYDEDIVLFTGDTESLPFPDGYNQDGKIYMGHDGAHPACVLAIMPQVTTQDR
jgi:hypothetical protein